MPLERLDHVNVRTANLRAMTDFYQRVVGLKPGQRPPFSFSGAWLYLGDQAVLHLVETESPPAGAEPKIEHFAFRATGIDRFIARLETSSVSYRRATVPATGLEQVHFSDPDGNHVEVGFPPMTAA
ncbi:MAG TPA: VOC family protein [Gammaproteobacteria bacterium]|nr:VOC family protein [Gammaproteobacteria bacterium]